MLEISPQIVVNYVSFDCLFFLFNFCVYQKLRTTRKGTMVRVLENAKEIKKKITGAGAHKSKAILATATYVF